MLLYFHSSWSFSLAKNIPNNETYEKIAEWLSIYHTSTSVAEKERVKTLIVTHMYPVIRNIARKIARRAYDPIDDLTQAGFIGLLKAIERYSAEINDNFRIYAGYLIIGEIKHYLRDKLNTIRVPAYIQELSIRIQNFTADLTYEEVQALTSEEVATALDVPTRVVDYAMEAERRRSILSLDNLYTLCDNNLTYEEILSNENIQDNSIYDDARIIFENVIDKLPDEEKVLVDMYYKQDMNQKEIAEALLLTPMAVNRKLKNAFELIAQLVVETKQLEVRIIIDEDYK